MSSKLTLPILFAIAIFLLAISYTFEQIAYAHILPRMSVMGVELSIVMALAFNATKIALAWIIGAGDRLSQFSATLGKLIYISLSLLASYMVFAYNADAPLLDKVVRQHQAETRQYYQQRIQALTKNLDSEIESVQVRYQKQRKQANDQYLPLLKDLEEQRQQEMHITDANGNFIGKRYKEIMRQIELNKNALKRRIDELNAKESDEVAALRKEWRKGQAALMEEQNQAVQNITRDSLHDDDAAQNRYLTAAPRLTNKIFHTDLGATHLAMALSLLATLAAEFGPLLIVGYAARTARINRPQPEQDAPEPKSNKAEDDSLEKSDSSTSKVLPIRTAE